MRPRGSGQRTEKPENVKLDWEIIRSLIPYLKAYSGRTAFSIALLIAAKAATVAVPLLLKRIVDALDVNDTSLLVIPLAILIAYGALRLASTLFRELQSIVFARVRFGIMRNISVQVVEHLHQLSLRFHLERHTGEVARDLGRGTSSISSLLSYLLFNIVPTLVEVAMVSTILFSQYNGGFTAVAVVTVVLYIAFTFAVTRWRIKFRTEMNRRDSEATSRAIDGLLNYETVKYFNNEAYEVGRYQSSLKEWEDVAYKSQTSLSVLNAGQGLLIAIGVTLTMILAAQGRVDGTMTTGDLVAVNAFLLQLFLPLGFLGTVYSQLRHTLTDMERMFGLLEREPEVKDAPNAPPLHLHGATVAFRNVNFSYDPDRQILHNVSFEIPAGTTTAVVGSSGSGKSTLARLLYRFYDIQDGVVSIDGQDVRSVTQDSLRAAIGTVPQDTVLFNDTLRENLAYGNLNAPLSEVDRVVEMAQLTDFIASLPHGLDTMVGERGLKLSGGEKQRVAIARTFLKDPAIVLFDEATSSLDSRSEQAIVEAMRALEGDRTTLVIAHRLSTIVHADQIIVLEQGSIAERGTHSELLALDGVYADLWKLQLHDADDNTTEA